MSGSKHVYEAELRVRCRVTAHSFEEAMGTALQQHLGDVRFNWTRMRAVIGSDAGTWMSGLWYTDRVSGDVLPCSEQTLAAGIRGVKVPILG